MASLLFSLLEDSGFQEGVHWQRLSVPANSTIFSEGDQGREVYLVLAGSLRVLGRIDLEDYRNIQPGFGELGQGDVFGELMLFADLPRSATVASLTEVELAVINADDLLGYLDQHPEIGYPIMKELLSIVVMRLRKANRRIFSLFAWGLKSQGIDDHL